MRDWSTCRGPHGFGMPGPLMGFSRFSPLKYILMGVEVTEDEKTLTISIPMPGVTRDDIELNLGPDMAVITLKEEERPEQEETTKQKEEMPYAMPWLFRAGHAPHGTRRFPLPTEIDPDTAKAKLENGILKISADKKNPGKKIPVD